MESPKKGSQWVLFVAALIPVLTCVYAFSLGPSPEKALHAFYQHEGPEAKFLDPLIAEGRAVVPSVLRELPKPEMPRRVHAIRFLGQGKYEEAIPALRAILFKKTEKPSTRSEALRALALIDLAGARRSAAPFRNRDDVLGARARGLFEEEQARIESDAPPHN